MARTLAMRSSSIVDLIIVGDITVMPTLLARGDGVIE
jgi:hypothetical protein